VLTSECHSKTFGAKYGVWTSDGNGLDFWEFYPNRTDSHHWVERSTTELCPHGKYQSFRISRTLFLQ